MDNLILDGFNDEMEKIAALGTVLRLGAKGVYNLVKKNKLTTAFGGLSIHGATQKTLSKVPGRVAKLPGRTYVPGT